MQLTSARHVLVAMLTVLGLLGAPAAAHADPGKSGDHAMGWYVALGDSLAAGYQPGQGDDKDGGYVGDVLAGLQRTEGKTRLINLGCSGETTTSMIAGGHCNYAKGSQLDQAVQVLHAHRQHIRLVTLDIGANDVGGCVSALGAIDMDCISRGLSTVGENLPRILGEVRAAAPQARIVVLDYYNPFLAAWFMGPAGQQLAQQSVLLQQVLNTTITLAAMGVGAQVAQVATAFRSTDWTPVTLPGAGEVPTNVATICSWTWMCSRRDIHTNDAGYDVLAGAVLAQVALTRQAAPVPAR